VPSDFLSSFDKLREIGFATRDGHKDTAIQTTLSSITSKCLSTVSLELAHPDWSRSYRSQEEFRKWWDDLETVLCHLADRRLENDLSPLVFEIVWWRQAGHGGDCGMMYTDMIMPKFREKGSIRFAESDLSSCQLCVNIMEMVKIWSKAK